MGKLKETINEEAQELERMFDEHTKLEVDLLKEHIKSAQRVVESLQGHYKMLTGQRYHW